MHRQETSHRKENDHLVHLSTKYKQIVKIFYTLTHNFQICFRYATLQQRLFYSSVVYTQLTGGRTMQLSLKGRIAKIFNHIVVGGVGDVARRGQSSTVIGDVTGGLDVSAHTIFIISQSLSAEVCVKPAVSCAQAVKLHSCFARHVPSWWRVSETGGSSGLG